MLGTQRRDTVRVLVGKYGVRAIGDHTIVIRKHRQLGMEKLPLRSFGTTDEYEGSIPSLVTNKLFELKINDNIALLKTM